MYRIVTEDMEIDGYYDKLHVLQRDISVWFQVIT
jgi:hypothetical protein